LLFSDESFELKVPTRATITPEVKEHFIAGALEAFELKDMKTHQIGRNGETKNPGS